MMASAPQAEKRASSVEARVGFINASPLVRLCQEGRREKMGLLGVAKEGEMFREALQKSGLQIAFRAVVATPYCVGELLNDDPQIIHYVGHGDKGCLSFESDVDRKCGIMEPLEVSALRDLLQSQHAGPKLVFISSCCSEFSGTAFADAGVLHVVAVKAGESVADEVAHLFGKLFYDALLSPQRYTVQAAFDRASTIASIGSNAGNSDGVGRPFILLPRGRNHDVRMFDQVPRGNFIDKTPPLPEVHPCLPGAREPYLGTEPLQKLLGKLLNPLVVCVTVVGERGSGKSQMVIQACKYARERRKFDVMYFARCDEITQRADVRGRRGRAPVQDPCWLIGRALGMDPPPESVERLTDFLFKREEGRPSPRTALLVLDGVHALVEEWDRDARARFLEFMSSLCSRKYYYKLKLLVTSNFRLRDASYNTCFDSGTEKVLKVAPLGGTDPAQLFFDALSRPLTRGELGVARGCNHRELLEKLLPLLEKAEGHPKTLVMLASDDSRPDLKSPSFAEAAARFREMLRSVPPPPSFTPTFSRCNSDDSPFGDNLNLDRRGGGRGAQRFLPQAAGMRRASIDGPYPHRPQQQEQRALEDAISEMYSRQQRARGAASRGGLNPPGSLVWEKAIANAKEERDRRSGGRDRPMAGGDIYGRTNFVPLKYLIDGLQELLCRQQMTSSYDYPAGGYARYECLTDEPMDLRGWGTYDVIDASTPRYINEEMVYVKARLLREEGVVRDDIDTQPISLGPNDDDDQHAISLEAFVRFSEWLAPVIATLSRLENWSSSDFMRVHWFLSRKEALGVLSQKEAGTFLLRFSETKVGALVISVRNQEPRRRVSTGLLVTNCLVEVDERGMCHVLIGERRAASYTSLNDLVLRYTLMQTLFPDIPKEQAFQVMLP